MDSNEQFVQTESRIREIICLEINHAQESNVASNRQRKVSFSGKLWQTKSAETPRAATAPTTKEI